NLLWLLFTAPSMRTLFDPWQDQALQILSSFRRDFVRAPQDPDIGSLVRDLEKVDPDFRTWWRQQDIHGPCQGIRHFQVADIGPVVFDHTSLSIDVDRDLRLVYYAAREGQAPDRARAGGTRCRRSQLMAGPRERPICQGTWAGLRERDSCTRFIGTESNLG
ncbi:hypothetical protein ACRE81_26485, partial [Klebsiella pneumoniae]